MHSTEHRSESIPDALRHFDALPDSAHVRLPTVAALWGCSPVTVWRGVKSGRIPAPKRLSPRTACWNVGEIRRALQSATA
jgi:predicted DNA-binding transcriptional regulator AlpA